MPERTKNMILQAFNDLAKHREFENITVADICREAQITRSTFFRYFQDKYEVMTYNFERLFLQLVHDPDIHSFEEYFVRIYTLAREELAPVWKTLEVNGPNTIKDYVYTISCGIMDLNEGKDFGILTKEETFQVDLVATGLANVLQKWVTGEYDMTVEEIAHATVAMYPENFKKHFIREDWVESN